MIFLPYVHLQICYCNFTGTCLVFIKLSSPIMVEITSVKIFGILVNEPVTTFTDLMVSAVCFYAFYQLNKIKKPEKVMLFFKLYFLVMGIATTLGGILGHAFIYAIPFAWKLPGWVTSMIAIMFIERAAIEHTRILLHPTFISVLKALNIIEFLVFLSGLEGFKNT